MALALGAAMREVRVRTTPSQTSISVSAGARHASSSYIIIIIITIDVIDSPPSPSRAELTNASILHRDAASIQSAVSSFSGKPPARQPSASIVS